MKETLEEWRAMRDARLTLFANAEKGISNACRVAQETQKAFNEACAPGTRLTLYDKAQSAYLAAQEALVNACKDYIVAHKIKTDHFNAVMAEYKLGKFKPGPSPSPSRGRNKKR